MKSIDMIDRLLGLMASRSTLLKLEWDAMNSKHDLALEKAFGSLENAKRDAFANIYRDGKITEKDRTILRSLLQAKMPKRKMAERVKTPPIPGTEEWGVKPKEGKRF